MSSLLICAFGIAVTSILSLLVGQRAIDVHLATESTTVVVLNWSRPLNVNKIVSEICNHLDESDVPRITIWNNSPKQLSFEDFGNTTCPESRLHIINSVKNMYFQARYVACARANTRYCFMQDDDYLISPEIMKALILYMRASPHSLSSIHLQPPHEMLSSVLRTVHIGSRIQTTFAWLGYGTIIKRSQAVKFLAMLNEIDLTNEQRKMADNYFTILRNDVPERWFDPGLPLGGGQPFTVGLEGEERNSHHIIQAAKLLESISLKTEVHLDTQKLLYIELPPRLSLAASVNISRAPCHGRVCIFATSIPLLPESTFNITVSSALHILELEIQRIAYLGEGAISNYINFSPSNAVDQDTKTEFLSPEYGRKDEWIMLDLVAAGNRHDEMQLVLEVDETMQLILQKSVYETSDDGLHWTTRSEKVTCAHILEDSPNDSSSTAITTCLRCTYSGGAGGQMPVRYLRVRLLENVETKWRVYEMYTIPRQ